MHVPYKWLKEYVPDLPPSPEAIAARLTAAGLEVEGIASALEGFDQVVVGRLLEVSKHPNADRLTVCKVTLSSDPDAEFRQIVCGATNHKAGDKVAVALPGAVLPDGTVIKKGKMRGEVSDGMLCSPRELGLGTESDGIWILPPEAREGTPVAEAMALADWVFEIGITPNRGDCLSVLGVARELAAAMSLKLEPPKAAVEGAGPPASEAVRVRVEDEEGCPRYIARVIEGVSIGPSPAWLTTRLEQCGIRPINNVVDVTNYVMLESGQPLHAFDARQVGGGEIVVRPARSGETMKTLDEIERKLSPADLVIADAKRPVAMAGVMGGEHSGVLDDTKTVVLEAAWFDPGRVRRSSRAHGLHTESSHRFERSVDPAGVERASTRAAALIAELGQGKVRAGSVEAGSSSFDVSPRRIGLTRARVRALLGVDPGPEEIADLLRPLQLLVEPAPTPGGDALVVTVPRFRADLLEEVDLVEEVARRYGYDRIPERKPRSRVTAEGHDPVLETVARAKDLLVGMGFFETVHLPFGARDEAGKLRLPPDDPRARVVPVANPLADDQAVLRACLLPALLANLGRNQAHKTSDVRVFELRPVFRNQPGRLPEENRRLTALMSGSREPAHWDCKPAPLDFFDVKGVLEGLLQHFSAKPPSFSLSAEPFLVAGAQARVDCAGRTLGVVGEVHPDVLAAFGASSGSQAFVFDLDFEALSSLPRGTPRYTELPRFPSVRRDVALRVDESVEVGAMLAEARKFQKKGLERVDVFDLFRGEALGGGKKSVALEMTWRAPDRTLTDEEVNAVQEKLVAGLIARFKAERR